jgi:hypothetical protein
MKGGACSQLGVIMQFVEARRSVDHVVCMHILLYCLEVCDLSKSTIAIASSAFCVRRFGFRIFRTDNSQVVRHEALELFNVLIVTERFTRMRAAGFQLNCSELTMYSACRSY